MGNEAKHFVLIHGGCHGAWCWFKLKPLLESFGHRVTALDLAASGINPKQLHQLRTFADYTSPLLEFMASLPLHEKVILVGHSFGGMSLALAMEKFPEKILVAVFLTACMPDTAHSPSYVLDKFKYGNMSKERNSAEALLDTKSWPFGSPENPLTAHLCGPKLLSLKLYQLCKPEDLELAKLLVRPCSLFAEDLSKRPNFSNEGYGSVKKAYILCHEDKAMPLDFQQWMIHNTIGVEQVMDIKDADHMSMLSKPKMLCDLCHGAWCWFKLKPLLESFGHRVTALDLAASGINPKQLHQLRTFADYTSPLLEFMASIPLHEKLELAMEKFPEKILVAVFLTAFMPDTVHPPSYVLETFMERTPAEAWLDTKFWPFGSPENPLTALFLGPKFSALKLYQLSPIEDLELAKLLVRPSSLFVEDLSKRPNFSKEGHGSVKRAYILCHEDKAIPLDFQQWMIHNSIGVEQVKDIKDADHMAMLSKPKRVCDHLLDVAHHFKSGHDLAIRPC
ncbi:hypothetical protein M9H77_15741 [Catharanthus roseus]|uniref:Uncharacterized protein n=1 Tax=Catharanthus roseus TaxID=4058 RepID=A0ACC0B133_CATRO|nr:hypothetical protein M9H77_15741 [Catharanthus roseus]